MAAEHEPTRLLFVCLGNICRSPTAEGVMRSLADEAGLQGSVELDSAGTGAWHVGSPPDARAVAAAAARGITLEGYDRQNLRELRQLADGERRRAKVRLLREFDPDSDGEELEVPDPYYGAAGGFD